MTYIYFDGLEEELSRPVGFHPNVVVEVHLRVKELEYLLKLMDEQKKACRCGGCLRGCQA